MSIQLTFMIICILLEVTTESSLTTQALVWDIEITTQLLEVTTESDVTTSSFILDVDCSSTVDGEYYVGNVNMTISGIQCQRWDEQSPHVHNK